MSGISSGGGSLPYSSYSAKVRHYFANNFVVTEFENGLYEVAAVVGTDFGGDVPPLDAISAQIVISN